LDERIDDTDTTPAKVDQPQTPTQASFMEIDEPSADDGLPSNEHVQECQGVTVQQEVPIPNETLSNREIDEIQSHLGKITRPSWHQGAPQNLGNAEHRKLKAEKWRGSIEFDLPVVLWKLWGGKHSNEDSEQCSRQRKLAESTLLLATAIQWGSSYVTSKEHAHQYKHYMRKYFKSLKQVFPGVNWWLNHHAALHIDSFLNQYGPLHGWWMFPFKRIIGCLQKMRTNHKSG
jgi:hypothetical protein